MRFMTWFVRIAGIYNASAIVIFLAPGAPDAVGLRLPGAQFWVWLPSLVGLFAGIVLVLSSVDLRRVGAFPYWNGITRLIFVASVFVLGLSEGAGAFVVVLALGPICGPTPRRRLTGRSSGCVRQSPGGYPGRDRRSTWWPATWR
jgi:hypothetical protein